MNLHDLKHEFPEIPKDIQNMIEAEVSKQLRQKKTKLNWFCKYKTAVAIIAITLITGTTVYAANRILQMRTEQIGKYGADTIIEQDNGTADDIATSDDAETSPLIMDPSRISEAPVPPLVTLDFNYMPDNLYKANAGKIQIINSTTNNSAISIFFSYVPESIDMYKLSDTNVISREDYEIDGNPAVCFEFAYVKTSYQDLTHKIYVFYPECRYLMTMYVYESIDISEAKKIAEGMVLNITDNKNADNLIDVDTVTVQNESDNNYLSNTASAYADNSDKLTSISKDKMANTHSIGEQFEITSDLNNKTATVSVKEVIIADDLSPLNPEIAELFLGKKPDFIDSDGKLIPETIQFVKYGDGYNTLPEIVNTKEVPMKLVYIAIDITNSTDETIEEFLYRCKLMRIEENEDSYEIYNYCPNDITEDYDDIVASVYRLEPTVPIYYYNGNDFYEKNTVYSLKPGETRTVYEAYIIAESELDKMYLDLRTTAVEDISFFEPKSLKLGLVDIRQ